MEHLYIYPHWGSAHLEWGTFLTRVKEAGYDGVELGIPSEEAERRDVLDIMADLDLKVIAQHYHTGESDFRKHKHSLERHLYQFSASEPLLINSHTGKDYFSFRENAELLTLAHRIEEETGVPVAHETHRSRFAFAAHVCYPFLKEFPFLKLTADFSHWCSVAESMLEDQKEAVQLAMEHTIHVHARVGSAQSAQVINPETPLFSSEKNQFLSWWKEIAERASKKGLNQLGFVPEYGPAPYQQVHPQTGEVLANQWEVNQFVKRELEHVLNSISS
ncbi:MAG: sugar phosphate isomerase/epimerase [Bacteroidota bacterium]